MRTLLILITLCVVMLLGSASPINQKRLRINRPNPDVIDRSSDSHRHAVKGRSRSFTMPVPKPEYNLRKGEYMRDNQVHKLKPGEIPKNCPEGMCQYPI